MPVTLEVGQLGAELKRVREERGMSLRDVEAEASVSLATLSRLERGAVVPDWSVVDKLARWLGVEVKATQAAGAGDLGVETDEDLKRVIALHLRANKRLSEKVARAIVDSFDVIVRIESEKAAKKKPKL